LYKNATQTVFGAGGVHSRLVLVGEQPGNDEDLSGKPFVGPAGRLLDEALERAGIDRETSYLTNAVKHFKWEPKGTRRLHKKPGAREITACLPWLEAEIALLEPEVLVLLGATAVQAVLGSGVRVTEQRGKVVESRLSKVTLPTVHPSSLLRLPPDADREAEMERFVADLGVAARLLARR
jgi:uracil-DNA glycosylase family protein